MRRSDTKSFTSSVLPALVMILAMAMVFGASRPAVAGTILDEPILDEPILGGQLLVAEDGEVWARFLGSDAGYFNELYLGDVMIFDKSSPLDSDMIFLGSFDAGTELVFRLFVTNTDESFYSGDPSRNPDGLAHALAITTFDELTDTYVTTVGFEDLLGGGDEDYNDFEFLLTNVIDPPAAVPAPPVVMLLLIGLAGFGYQRRNTVKAA